MSPLFSEIFPAAVRSLAMASAVAALSGLLGIAMAWLLTRTDAWGNRMLGGILAIPYAIPAFLLGMAWVVLGNPTVGILRDWLPASGSYGFWPIVLVETSVAFAFPYLELRAGFERMDSALEEAARMSGARPGRVFRDISLPLLWPSLVNGMVLAFLYALSSFGVPALLGMPVRQFFLTTLIYSQIKLGGAAGLQNGLSLAGVLLAFAIVVLGFSHALGRRRRSRRAAIQGAKASRPSRVRLGAWRAPASVAAWLFFIVAVVVPWCGLAISALAPVAGRYAPAEWTLKNLRYVLTHSEFQGALIHSLSLAIGVSFIIVLTGFGLGFLAVRRHRRVAAALIEAQAIPFATPGSVIAIVVIFLSIRLAIALQSIGIEADWPLFWFAIAYYLKYAAVGGRTLMAAFRQVSPALEEAARVSGARTARLLWDIWWPLLRRTIRGVALLSALPILTELTMSVLLTGPGASTLGTFLFQLQEYSDQGSAAALAWMLLTVALIMAFAAGLSREESRA